MRTDSVSSGTAASAASRIPSQVAQGLPKPKLSYFAEKGVCIVCGSFGEQGGTRCREGGPFFHQSCYGVAHRMAFDPMPGDDEFIARCDAAGSSAAALATMLFYVPSSLIEDFIMGQV